MTPAKLKAAVEAGLPCRPIPQDTFDEAEALGRAKLDRINARYGTDHGDDYLVELIREAVVAAAMAARYNGRGAAA